MVSFLEFHHLLLRVRQHCHQLDKLSLHAGGRVDGSWG